jgi:hypothetical protein
MNSGRYNGQPYVDGSYRNLGIFDTAEEAAKAHDRYLQIIIMHFYILVITAYSFVFIRPFAY